MALKPRQAGPNITGAFSVGLAEAPDLGKEYLANVSYHLPAYTLSLKDLNSLRNGQGIDSVAKEVAWQCLAVSNTPDEAAVVGEVTPVQKAARPAGRVFDGPVRMTSLSHGDVINTAYKSSKDLHGRQEDLARKYQLKDDYEPRMLRIPGLLVTAFWLKSQAQDGTDWVVPLHTKIEDLRKEEMYTLHDFLEITKPLAAERLASQIFD